ncbi:MAG: hypothetical protein U0L17_05170 [Acutalibacteraceae bacterium]|nr:hypothetical protein [Acutalibacteraceae bacterium]
MKKVLAILLAMVTLLSFSFNVFALSEDENVKEEAGLFYLYTSSVSSNISISSKTATCNSVVTGIIGTTTKIVITQRLQKKNGDSWTNVQSWTKTVSGYTTSFTNKKSSLASGTYRTRTVAKVYKGTAYETITVNSKTATC